MPASYNFTTFKRGKAKMANESDADYSGNSGQTSGPDIIVIINCVLNTPLMLKVLISIMVAGG